MHTQQFTVDSTRHNDGWILTLKGELDMGTVPHIQEVMDSWMFVPNHLIVDASGLSFIDSTGLGVLLRALELVGGHLTISQPSEPTLRLLELTGLAELIKVQPTPPS
jgi:anti-anti-sigma factor